MSNEELKIFITEIVPDAVFEENKQFLLVTVNAEHILDLAGKLKNNAQTNFDYLFCLTGVDWLTYLSVVYHLKSITHNHSIVLKAKISDRVNPEIESVCSIWRTAEFHEREIYDLLGIRFNHHPDLRRLLLDDDWKGYPLRKDYADEANIVELE